MLGIQTIVAAMPHHVAGEDMVALVEGEGLAMNDDRNQDHLQNDQAARKGPDGYFQSIHRLSASQIYVCNAIADDNAMCNHSRLQRFKRASTTSRPVLYTNIRSCASMTIWTDQREIQFTLSRWGGNWSERTRFGFSLDPHPAASLPRRWGGRCQVSPFCTFS